MCTKCICEYSRHLYILYKDCDRLLSILTMPGIGNPASLFVTLFDSIKNPICLEIWDDFITLGDPIFEVSIEGKKKSTFLLEFKLFLVNKTVLEFHKAYTMCPKCSLCVKVCKKIKLEF